MKFIKKHKLAIFILVMIIAIVVAGLVFGNTIMFDESEAIYGTRLEGIEKVEVTSKQKKEVEDNLKESVEGVKVRTAGKVIYITIYVKNGTDAATAKTYADKALESFTDDQKSFYDIQLLIDNEEDTEHYPILGYKHRAKDAIAWTKDR